MIANVLKGHCRVDDFFNYHYYSYFFLILKKQLSVGLLWKSSDRKSLYFRRFQQLFFLFFVSYNSSFTTFSKHFPTTKVIMAIINLLLQMNERFKGINEPALSIKVMFSNILIAQVSIFPFIRAKRGQSCTFDWKRNFQSNQFYSTSIVSSTVNILMWKHLLNELGDILPTRSSCLLT